MKLALLLDIPDAALEAAHLTPANMLTRGSLAAANVAGLFPGKVVHSAALVEDGPRKLSFADVKALVVRGLINEGTAVPETLDWAQNMVDLRVALIGAGIPVLGVVPFMLDSTCEPK